MEKRRNFKAVMIALIALIPAGCSHDAPVHSPAETFAVVGEDRSPDGNAITVNIKVGSQASESEAKAAAEAAISKYRNEYAKVTVKSFRRDDAREIPFGVSTLEGGQVRHVFNTPVQKIPTH